MRPRTLIADDIDSVDAWYLTPASNLMRQTDEIAAVCALLLRAQQRLQALEMEISRGGDDDSSDQTA